MFTHPQESADRKDDIRVLVVWNDDQVINRPELFVVAIKNGRAVNFRSAVSGAQLNDIDPLLGNRLWRSLRVRCLYVNAHCEGRRYKTDRFFHRYSLW